MVVIGVGEARQGRVARRCEAIAYGKEMDGDAGRCNEMATRWKEIARRWEDARRRDAVWQGPLRVSSIREEVR